MGAAEEKGVGGDGEGGRMARRGEGELVLCGSGDNILPRQT